ncbi:MAG: amidohydrolase [Bacteroidales bacterium]|nr:amidohydrolase [Bacteroidales bacterium]
MDASILLKDITVEGRTSDILIRGGLIEKILPHKNMLDYLQKLSPAIPQKDIRSVDCSGRTAMPGFINMHTHAAMSIMRGMQEDMVFNDWIKSIWEAEKNVDEDYVYWGTQVAALEMIRTGTTTFNDMYWYPRKAMKSAESMGIRPVISSVILDGGDRKTAARQKLMCERLYRSSLQWKGDAVFVVGVHAVYSVSEEMLLWASEFTKQNDLLLQVHLSETLKEVNDCKAAHGGLTPVQYLDRLGALSERTIAAHSLWLSPADVRILGERKVNCVHCIGSNAKLSAGYKFLYNELRDAGANICLGTDGCASAGNLDMMEAMKTSAIVQKAWRGDPVAWPLKELIDCATVNGAKALRLNTGSLEEGKAADILIINTDSPFFLSPAPFLTNLVYSAHSDCIESVIIGGKFVMKDRKIRSEKKVIEHARSIIRRNMD